MDQYVYEGLIGRLEAEAAHSPSAFRNKVVLITCAAYLVLFASLITVSVLLYAGFNWARTASRLSMITFSVFALSMVPVFYAVARMFFMRLSAPQGRPAAESLGQAHR